MYLENYDQKGEEITLYLSITLICIKIRESSPSTSKGAGCRTVGENKLQAKVLLQPVLIHSSSPRPCPVYVSHFWVKTWHYFIKTMCLWHRRGEKEQSPAGVVPGTRCHSELWGNGQEKTRRTMKTTKMRSPMVKVGQRWAATLRIRNLMTGCADAIIKSEMLFKWQLNPSPPKKKLFQEREERLQWPL